MGEAKKDSLFEQGRSTQKSKIDSEESTEVGCDSDPISLQME